MPGKAWPRILLCGILAGVAWYGLSAILLALLAQPFLAWARIGGPEPHWVGGINFAIDLVMGIWAVWLYAAITPRYGTRLRTALVVGLAWWLIKTLQSAKWAGLGLIPAGLIPVPLLVTLLAAGSAAVIGAWLYDGFGKRG